MVSEPCHADGNCLFLVFGADCTAGNTGLDCDAELGGVDLARYLPIGASCVILILCDIDSIDRRWDGSAGVVVDDVQGIAAESTEEVIVS